MGFAATRGIGIGATSPAVGTRRPNDEIGQSIDVKFGYGFKITVLRNTVNIRIC